MYKPRVYIASSWKNDITCLALAKVLRKNDIEVDCFCDDSTGRFMFSWMEFGKTAEEVLENYDAIEFLKEPKVQKAFMEDKKWLDWCDVCVMVLPCGKSSHLEAGYSKGHGRKLYIFGEFKKGEFDVMYGFADGLFGKENINELIKEIKKFKPMIFCVDYGTCPHRDMDLKCGEECEYFKKGKEH